MTEQNRPPHGQEPAQDPQDMFRDGDAYSDSRSDARDGAYDDAYAYTAADSSDALGAPSRGAHEAFDFTDENSDENDAHEELGAPAQSEKSGPPLRGLAMILTAVAVVLIIWGAWSLFSSDDTDDSSDVAATASASAPAPAANSAADGASAAESTPTSAAPPEAPLAGEVNRATTHIVVLNNSANDPIAGPTAEQLRSNGWESAGYGNLSGRVDGISEQSRVYYPEGDTTAQAAAEQIGAELGLPVAAGNADYYDRFGEAAIREGSGADGIVVVLTGAAG